MSEKEESNQTPSSPSEAPPMTDNSSPKSEDQLSAEDLEEGVAAAQEEEQMAAEKSPAPVKNETEAGTNVDETNGDGDDIKRLVETDLEEGVATATAPTTDNSPPKSEEEQTPDEKSPAPVNEKSKSEISLDANNDDGDDSKSLVKADLEEGVAKAPITDYSSPKSQEQMPAEKSPAPVKNETEAGTNVDANKDNENNNKRLLETDLEEGGGAAVLKSNNSSMPGAFAVNNPFFDEQRAEALRSTSAEDNNLEEADLTTDSPVDPSNNNSNNPDEGLPQGLLVASNSTVVIGLPMESPQAAPSDSTNKNRKDCGMKTFLAVVLFLILMVAILIGVNLSNRKENDLGEEPYPPAEAGTDGLEPDDKLDDKILEERYSAMIDLLAPLSGGPEVFDPQHPSASLDRISALRWIVEEDTAQFPIPQTAITTSDEDYGEVWKLRQRYVLALFYYATDGENWKNKYQFLSSFDVCRWGTAFQDGSEAGLLLTQPLVTHGAICDPDDRVTILNLYWNNLGGTIPDEISIWYDTMVQMNFGGGTISGTIPSSLANFTKLDSLSLGDNCLTGSIPDLHEIASLTIVQLNNNANQLTGSLNDKFCSSPTNTSLREGGLVWAVDSENACSCCFNCDPDRLECTDNTGQFIWKNHNMGDLDAIKSQFEKKCATPELKEWILDECPCVINVSTDLEVFPFSGECDTNCTDPELSYVYDGYP